MIVAFKLEYIGTEKAKYFGLEFFPLASAKQIIFSAENRISIIVLRN